MSEKIRQSEALKELETLMEKHSYLWDARASENFDWHSEQLDQKIQRARFAQVVKNHSFYEELMGKVELTHQTLTELFDKIKTLEGRVI